MSDQVFYSLKIFFSFSAVIVLFTWWTYVFQNIPLICLLIFLNMYLATLGLSCSMWDLVPRPEFKLQPPALRAYSLRQWTNKEVP